jgi:hypothetical protein
MFNAHMHTYCNTCTIHGYMPAKLCPLQTECFAELWLLLLCFAVFCYCCLVSRCFAAYSLVAIAQPGIQGMSQIKSPTLSDIRLCVFATALGYSLLCHRTSVSAQAALGVQLAGVCVRSPCRRYCLALAFTSAGGSLAIGLAPLLHSCFASWGIPEFRSTLDDFAAVWVVDA